MGISLSNAEHVEDDTAQPVLNLLQSAHVFDGLTTDIILGTPAWRDWVKHLVQDEGQQYLVVTDGAGGEAKIAIEGAANPNHPGWLYQEDLAQVIIERRVG